MDIFGRGVDVIQPASVVSRIPFSALQFCFPPHLTHMSVEFYFSFTLFRRKSISLNNVILNPRNGFAEVKAHCTDLLKFLFGIKMIYFYSSLGHYSLVIENLFSNSILLF